MYYNVLCTRHTLEYVLERMTTFTINYLDACTYMDIDVGRLMHKAEFMV